MIFLSPYLTESQQRYGHAMTQAIGRARRYGQTKHVHIYHFLSLKTIDVDIMQIRTNKILTKVNTAVPVAPNHLPPAPTPLPSPFPAFVSSGFELIEAAWGETDTGGEFGSREAS